jgi:cyd operon protein YbgT
MWYFAWILGVTMAVLLASISAMMCDAKECALDEARNTAADNTQQS